MPVRSYQPKTYTPHTCSPACLQANDPTQFYGNNPLCIPVYMGFERSISRIQMQTQEIKHIVMYRGPCGKMFRNLSEVAAYLCVTESALTIDYFSTDENVFLYP